MVTFSTGMVEGENAIHFHDFRGVEKRDQWGDLLSKGWEGTYISFEDDRYPPTLLLVFHQHENCIPDKVFDRGRIEAIWTAKDETLTLTHSHLNVLQGCLEDVRSLLFRFGGRSNELIKPVEVLSAKNNWMRVRKTRSPRKET